MVANELKPGWAKKELEKVAKEISTWPAWMQAAAIPRKKNGRP